MLLKQKPALFIGLLIFCMLSVVGKVPAAPQSEIASAVFTTSIQDRTPVDQVLLLTNKTNKIFFHTDLRHFENQRIIHRWEYNGEVVLSKIFDVQGPRWRVYSAKTLASDQLGTWRVVVTNAQGWPLKATIFKYIDSETGSSAIMPFSE